MTYPFIDDWEAKDQANRKAKQRLFKAAESPAMEQVEAMVKVLRKEDAFGNLPDDGMDYAQAVVKVITEHPDLYDQAYGVSEVRKAEMDFWTSLKPHYRDAKQAWNELEANPAEYDDHVRSTK